MKKQILSIILVVALLVPLFPSVSFADYAAGDTLEGALAKLQVAYKGNPLNWLTLKGTVREQTYTYFRFRNDRVGSVEEHPVYCIDPNLYGVPKSGILPDGTESMAYYVSEKVGDARYISILNMGYPHQSLASLGLQTANEAYYATKMALWAYILGCSQTDFGINPAYAGDPAALRVYDVALKIFSDSAPAAAAGIVEPAITLTPDRPVPYLDATGQYYRQIVTIHSTAWVGDTPGTLGAFRLEWVNSDIVPAGTKIYKADGTDITSAMEVSAEQSGSYNFNAQIEIRYPAASVDGEGLTAGPELTVYGLLAGNNIFTAYYIADTPGNQSYQRYLVEADPKQEKEASLLSQFAPDIDYEMGIRIKKLEKGPSVPLEGAVFDILDPDGARIYSLPTDANGVIDLPLARAGTYTVTERVPSIFHLPAEIRTQTVTVEYNKVAEVTFENDAYGTLRVSKKDSANGANLANALIQIKHIVTGQTMTGSTEASGNAVFEKLVPGAYEIRELAAPNAGYVLDTEVHTVNVAPLTSGITSYTLTNAAKPGLRLRKIDLERATPIAGVTFEVWQDASLYGEYVTDASGEIFIPDLMPGTYLVREIATVEPYVLDSTPQWIELSEGDGIRELIFTDAEKTGIYIVKVDAETLAPLPNAEFHIERVGGGFSQDLFSDANGEINISHLDTGVFQIFEKTAPAGHLPDTSVRTVEILPAKPDARFVFTDFKKPSLEIVKYDARNGIYVAGATFRIAKIEDGTHYLDRVSDVNGRITIEDLEPGIYSVQEIAANGNYILNDREYHVELFPGKRSQLVVENLRRPSLIVRKYDMSSAEPLAGAEFSIVKKDNSFTYEGVTNEEGFIRLDNLSEGWFTVTELAPPPHYLPSSPISKDVYLKAGETAEIKFDDLPCPILTINKIDRDTLEPLAGVNFGVKYAPNVSFDGGVVDLGTFTTDAAGQIVMDDDLKSGWYRVTELAPLPDYVFGGPAAQDIFLGGGDNKTLVFENIKKPSLIIRKYDGQTAEPLASTEFSVRRKDGPIIYEGLTDQDGKIVLTDIEPGYLTITELMPPPHYLPAFPASRDVYLEAGQTLEVKFDNLKCPTLTIGKTDSVTHDPIGNVRFNVRFSPNVNFTGGVIDLGDYLTDVGGRMVLDDLKSGWFRVTELEPEHGYAMKEPVTQDIFLEGGDNKVLHFENIPLSALIIRKTDGETGLPVAGATFTVKYLAGTSGSGGTTIHTGVTSINGTIVLTGLKAGTYVCEETKSAPSYELSNPSIQTAYISGLDQDVVTLVFENARQGGLIIKKLDSVTKQPIKDVVFKVTDSSGGVIGPGNGEYTTDAEGLINIGEDLPIGSTVIVQEIRCPDEYIIDTTEQSVKIKENTTHVLTFYNTKKGGLLLTKKDSSDLSPIEGVSFLVTMADGSLVGESNGVFKTDASGSVLIQGVKGTVLVREIAAKEGYILDDTAKSIEVGDEKLYTLEFLNARKGGLHLLKLDEEKRIPIMNVEYELSRMNGERLGTYRTNASGIIAIPDLESGWYTIVEKSAKGYILDDTVHEFEIKEGETTRLELTNRKASSLMIHKVDSVSGRGIYGVTFLLYDENKNPILQLTTDQSGFAYPDKDLPDGRFYLRELEPAEGYEPDDEMKTVYVEYGKTSLIEWTNKPITAQIQIMKYSLDYNPVTGTPAGSPLKGAVLEVTRARSGAVVCYITSDARGVAATEPLPLGRYFIKEVTAPPFYGISDERHEAELEYPGQIIRISVYDKSALLGTTIKKTGNIEVMAGDSMRYDFSGIANTSNVPLSDFYWTDRLPTDAARAVTLVTGTYNKRVYYRALYKTNYGDYRVLAQNLLSTNNYSFSIAENVLGLMPGETVTDVKLEFGTVEAGFASVTKPMLVVQTLPNLPSGYQIVNRCEVGGVYQGAPQVSTAAWVTKVIRFGSVPSLPKTGY